jgi:hypothetical protein
LRAYYKIYKSTKKVTFKLEQDFEVPEGEKKYRYTLSLTSALDGAGWST